MQVNSIQYETFGANPTKTVAKKGYAILVDGERYIVGAGKDAIAKNGGAKNAIVNAIKKVTAQPVAKTGLNLIA